MSLVTCLLPTSAVDEWIMRSRAMQELDLEYVWFRPMIESMAYKLLEEASWGLAMRVIIGAMICVSDVATDVYMVFYFFSKSGDLGTGEGGDDDNNNRWFGIITLVLIMLSVLCQLTIVHWNGRENQFKEKLIVASCLKPLMDAYRMVKQVRAELREESQRRRSLTLSARHRTSKKPAL